MKTATKLASEPRDYLVYCGIGGGGSWARDSDLEKAVKRCRSIVHSDWRGLFNMDGAEVTLSLFDITGQDRVTFGGGEIRGDNPDAPILNLGPRVVTLPRGRR